MNVEDADLSRTLNKKKKQPKQTQYQPSAFGARPASTSSFAVTLAAHVLFVCVTLLQFGMVLSTLASEFAVATSPNLDTLSIVPVGKNGRNNLKLFGSNFGNAVMTENCSKKTAGE